MESALSSLTNHGSTVKRVPKQCNLINSLDFTEILLPPHSYIDSENIEDSPVFMKVLDKL